MTVALVRVGSVLGLGLLAQRQLKKGLGVTFRSETDKDPGRAFRHRPGFGS